MSAAITKAEDLAGANFARVLAALAAEIDGRKLTANLKADRSQYRTLFAIEPADEYLQFRTLLRGSAGISPEHELFETANWSLHDETCDIDRLTQAGGPGSFFGYYNSSLTMLTGVERFGADEHSDGCLVGLWADGDSHPTFVYNHEIGEIETVRSGSICSLFADAFGVGPDPDPDEDEDVQAEDAEFPAALGASRESVAAHIAAFEKSRSRSGDSSQRPFYRDPIRLFQRAHWLLDYMSGEATFQFEVHLRAAPTFRDWEQERELIGREFPIAIYWLLHHFFLGNRLALETSLALIEDAPGPGPGAVARFLAQATREYLTASDGDEGPVARWLGLEGAQVESLIALSRRNAGPALFEEEERAKIKAERGESGVRRLNNEAFEKIAGDHEALWAALEEYPDDVAGHNRILKALSATAGQNQGLKTAIKDYFDERHADAFNKWPSPTELKRGYQLDPRLATPIAAAFVAGLKYSSGHENACCGVTIALGVLDSDRSMDAFAKAIDILEPNDERAEYVFQALARSEHMRATELLDRAAWRFFENLQTAMGQERALQAKREKEGVNLNNMWGVENFFHIPLQICLERGDAGAEKLARAIFEIETDGQKFKKNFGRAMRVCGERGLAEFRESISDFIDRRRKQKVDLWATMGLDEMCVLCEAAIALARLDPARARAIIPEWFAESFASREYDLAIKATLLGAMFVLSRNNSGAEKIDEAELRGWLERLLGNRDNHERLAPALRAAAVAELPESFEWIRYHLYSDTNRFMRYHQFIKELAFAAARTCGHPDVPPFDDSDHFGMKLKGDYLVTALGQAERYHIGDVLKAIRKSKYQHPDAVSGIRDALIDILRFSVDDTGSTFDEYWGAWKAMAVQGVAGQAALQAVLDLEFCRPGLKNDTVFLMRLLESEAGAFDRVCEMSRERLLEELDSPGPGSLAYMDFVAARAWLTDAAAARPGIEAALRRQLQWPGGHFARENPIIPRLAMIYARYGEASRALFTEIIAALEGGDEYGADTNVAQLQAGHAACGSLAFSPAADLPARLKLKWDDRGKIEIHRDREHKLSVRFASEYGVFSGAFEDDEHLSEISRDFPDRETAAKRAGEIVDLAVVLGYAAPPPVKKKAGKKKKSGA